MKYRQESASNEDGSVVRRWEEPSSGLATRRPPHKNAKTARGFTLHSNVMVDHESELEHRVSVILQARRDVEALHSQYPVVIYVDADGITRNHTFDYFAVLKNGLRIAIAVKPFRKQEVMLDLLEQIRQSGLTGYNAQGLLAHKIFDQVILLTGVEANWDAYENAKDILRSRDHYHGDEYDGLALEILKFPDQFRFGELFRATGPTAKRWATAWALIDHNVITPVKSGRINNISWMTAVR